MSSGEQAKGSWVSIVVGCCGRRRTKKDTENQPLAQPAAGNTITTSPVANTSNVENADAHEEVTADGDKWHVPGVGRFANRAVYTFEGHSLPEGLEKSNYTVFCGNSNDIPFHRRFDSANVRCSRGFLRLVVPGGQRPSKQNGNAVSSAEVTTVEKNILHGSFRTTAIFSAEPGTCHGIFFYKSDTQECDIEYLTDPTSLSNNGPDAPIPLWYTNQAVDPTKLDKSSESGPAPSDCTIHAHEYRIDWTVDFTAFYIDGVFQTNFTNNIPNVPGSFVWNNWANGDKGWAVGPPNRENVLKIQKIVMYYDTASNESGDSG
ncbi:uncharacterized protein Z520_06750 [Fonsecaea multimorphosa CBS 102226]|uniref:GH16 domain-containing protein n=1 Tax=Fonsecaea multimorphosa CBS 102226 TaxID=1442371 RepID=A0A0D2KL08_9EURO|nr:uncharacterized protein Z520_06750 [Fonsecaea multimorphosa CBS 102226]KIX97298.1 hypothetical protein Z520_06750 [Fonsecaea multimorphosa CBS 102226]OAL23265.1 hypothetical protein AYO22_06315 [Fonsecaea multimorphosa]